jgi:PAS domain S-box-containing protein
VEYELAGTPCNETIHSGQISCLPDNLLDHFPKYAARGRKSYLGVPVLDPVDARVIGHVAFWDEKPIRPREITDQPIVRIFLSRIGAELRRKRADDTLRVAAGTLAPMTGEAFFQGLVECLAKSLPVRVAFIAECLDDPPTRVRTLARWQDDKLQPPKEYALVGYPCEATVGRGEELFIANGLGEKYPEERRVGLDSYIGIPVVDPTAGRVLGHLALLDDKPMPQSLPSNPLLRIFVSRIAAELRRKRTEDTMWMIAEASTPFSGPVFFRSLVRELANALSFREVFITECVDAASTRVRMLSHWVGDGFASNDEYDLAGTPCELTIRERRITFIGDQLEALYPTPAYRGDQAYLGLPIFESHGDRVIGHIAFYDDKPRQASVVASPVFRILASRAGVELLRKRAEDELRASEEKFRLLVENQSDLIIKLDAEGRYRFVSPSFCRFFGRKEEELLGQPFLPELHEDDRAMFARAYADVFVAPHRSHVEARVLTTNGWRWTAWAYSAMCDAQGRVLDIIASGREVTDRKRAEEAARAHLQTLAHVSRVSSMGEMASAIAHEVNQPLTAVVTYMQACSRLLASGQAKPEELIGIMGRVASQAERASEIIAHLRTFVRKHEANLAPVSMNGLVANVVALVMPDAQQHGVELATELATNLPEILADGIQIEQVLVNLARNAIEATHGGQCATRRVLVRTCRGADGAVLAQVEDTGPGFDDATAARLFEPFFTTKAAGTGIGLSISKSIIEAHGGRIAASRSVAGGACFTIALPALDRSGEAEKTVR